jgi:acetolactate decarboxylase
MPKLKARISESLMKALHEEQALTGETIDHIVSRALADSLQVDHGTLFQVSTAGALVEGVSGDIVSIRTLREHGDFGLGTFTGFDGEMAVLDGHFFQIKGDGSIIDAPDEAMAPFAVVTHFLPDHKFTLGGFASIADLVRQLDAHRDSENRFYGARVDGTFKTIRTRAVCKQPVGESLSGAADAQAIFDFADVHGTLMGFWTPAYASSVNITGWHLHFLSDDRKQGGHLLDCSGDGAECAFQQLNDLRIAIPETAAFLSAELSGDKSEALDKAEH